MTAHVLFNPLTYIDRLTRGGFSPEQARASAEALEGATRSDIAEVRAEVAASESRLRAEIAASESRLRAEIGGVRTEIGSVKTEIAGVRTEIAQSKNDTLRWVFTFILALVGAVFAIVKFVH